MKKTNKANSNKANSAVKNETAKKQNETAKNDILKKNDVHKKVFESLTLFDKLSCENEQNARNTRCDVASLACNRDDCTIIVRTDSTCTRRFLEIWGLKNNECRLCVKKREYSTIQSKKLDALFENHKDEKMSAKQKQYVFKADYKTIVVIAQLCIDSLKKADEKQTEK